jgi:hypothetical protein
MAACLPNFKTNGDAEAFPIPAPPPFGLPPGEYGPALDRWLASLVRCCDDDAWVQAYRQGVMGEPPPVEVRLDPHPPAGDTEGWRRWWRHYNEVFAEAGASADGLEYDSPPAPDPARARRRRRFRRRTKAIIRRELDQAIPHIVAAVVEVLRA